MSKIVGLSAQVSIIETELTLIQFRLKAEQGLQTMVAKFDANIGSMAKDLETIQNQIKAERKAYEKWKEIDYRRQKET